MDKAIQNNNLTLSASLAAVILCILFGTNAVAVKISFKGIGPLTDTALRFSIAALAIFLWTRVTGKSLKVSRDELKPVLIISSAFTVQMSLFHFGLNLTQASRASLIINLQPFLLLFFAHFFIPGDQITKRKLLGLTAGFSGLAIVFFDSSINTGQFKQGDIMVFCSTMIWALLTVYTKLIIHRLQPYKYVFYQMFIALPFFYLEGYLFDDMMIFNFDIGVLLALLYQSLVTAAFGFIAWALLLKRYGAVSLHVFIFIMPIVGIFFSWLLLDETITQYLAAALVLIVSGIMIIHIRGRKISIFPFRRSGFE